MDGLKINCVFTGMDTLAAILAALNRVKELDQLATRLMAIRSLHTLYMR